MTTIDVPADGIDHRQQEKRKVESRPPPARCYSPCNSAISRWFSWVKKLKHCHMIMLNYCGETQIRREKGFGKTSGDVLNGQRGSNSTSGESKVEFKMDDELSGRFRKEASFNLGVGFGLVYHSAAFRDELNKMMELRTQMQIILKNFEEAMETKKVNAVSRTSSAEMKATNPVDAAEYCSFLQKNSPLSNPADSRTTFVCDQSLEFDTATQERLSEGMNQLEEELEAELQRLQLHLDRELMLKHKEEGRMQMEVKSSTATSLSTRFGEVVDHPSEAESKEHDGVSPRELERRLHELLESRQEQRIKELEIALECANRELSEKEHEVTWWKNTASIISKHVPEPSHLHRVASPDTVTTKENEVFLKERANS